MISDEQMAQCLAILGTATGKEITKDILKVYAAVLQDLDPRELLSAVEWLIAEHKYPTLPTPAEIRSRSLLVRAPVAPTAIEAYGMASKCARLWGAHQDNLARGFNQLPTSIRKAIAAVGGWNRFCESEDPEMMRAHFARAYDPIITEQQRMAALPPNLVARIETIRTRQRRLSVNGAVDRVTEAMSIPRIHASEIGKPAQPEEPW